MSNAKEMNRYISKIERFSSHSGSEFRTILDEGMELLGFSDEACARLFDVSRPTITRWRNGSTSPVRGMRKLLADVLKKEAMSRIRVHNRRNNSRRVQDKKARKKIEPITA